jgi:hypothetical protein
MQEMKDGPEKKKKLLEQKAIYEQAIKKIEAGDIALEYEGQDKKFLELDRQFYREQNIKTPEDYYRHYHRWNYYSLDYYKQRLKDVKAELERL